MDGWLRRLELYVCVCGELMDHVARLSMSSEPVQSVPGEDQEIIFISFYFILFYFIIIIHRKEK